VIFADIRRWFISAFVVLALSWLPARMDGAVILFSATNIAGSTWEYSYEVSGTFSMNEAFLIEFDGSLYSTLQDPPPAVPDWTLIVFPTDPSTTPPSPGAFGAIADVNNPTLSNPFTIQFTFLGAGTPGSQPFTIFNSGGDPIESGETSEIPEPWSLSMIGCGLAALLCFRAIAEAVG
jgi:hypothetical protein